MHVSRSVAVQLECKFVMHKKMYTCQIEHTAPIIHKDSNLFITGSHSPEKTDEDVIKLYFRLSSVFLIHNDLVKKFPNVEMIELNNNRIHYLNAFENCGNITEMEIYQKIPQNISKDFFTDCVKLNLLTLQDTNIMTHSLENVFVNQKNLSCMTLMAETIPTLSKEHLKSLTNLSCFYFQGCVIDNIEENSFKSLKNLTILEITNSQMEIKPNLFAGCDSLTEIEISGNDKFKFQSGYEFHNLYTLKDLVLSKNMIKDINSKAFKDLIIVKKILLNENSIEILPRDLFINNKDLESLDLSSNKIFAIHPETFKNPTMLTELSMANNTCVDFNIMDGDMSIIEKKHASCFKNYADLVIECD